LKKINFFSLAEEILVIFSENDEDGTRRGMGEWREGRVLPVISKLSYALASSILFSSPTSLFSHSIDRDSNNRTCNQITTTTTMSEIVKRIKLTYNGMTSEGDGMG